MMAVVLLAGFAVYFYLEKEKRTFILFTAASALSAAGLLFTFTRGSWFAAAAALALIAFFTDKKIFAVFCIAEIGRASCRETV